MHSGWKAFLSGVLLLAGVLFGWVPAAAAQGPATKALVVHVAFADDRPVTMRVRVQLTKQTGVQVDENYTDERGEVSFGVSQGIYVIRVTGAEIEDETFGPFEIFDNEPGHSERVQVRLKPGQEYTEPPVASVSSLDLRAPGDARKHFRSGEKAVQTGQWEEARMYFEKAIQAYPQYVSAHNNLGVAWGKLGQPEKARAAFRRALSEDDHYPRPYYNLARMALGDGKPAEALPLMEKAVGFAPTDAECLTLLAHAQLAMGRLDAALATARKVHTVPHHGFAIAHLIAGIALENKKAPQEAAAEYAEFLKEAPDDPQAPAIRTALEKLRRP